MARQNSDRYPPPRSQLDRLLEKYGAYCQGCGCDFTDKPNDLEVDHIRPKSDGGTDAYENLALLCLRCNRTKSDTMTLTGLQLHNRREGVLLPLNEANLKLGRGTNFKWRAALAAVEELLAAEAPDEQAAYKAAEAQLAKAYPDEWEELIVSEWAKKRSADARLEAAGELLANMAPDEWAAYKAAMEEYQAAEAAWEVTPDEWAAEAAEKKAHEAYQKVYEEAEKAKQEAAEATKTAEKKAWEVYQKATIAAEQKAVEAYLKAKMTAKQKAMEAYEEAYQKAKITAKQKTEEAYLKAEKEWEAYKDGTMTAKQEKAYEAKQWEVYKKGEQEAKKAAVEAGAVHQKAYEEGIQEADAVYQKAYEEGIQEADAVYQKARQEADAVKQKAIKQEATKAAQEAYKEAKQEAKKAALEAYEAMTPDEWAVERTLYLRKQLWGPVDEAETALRSAASDAWAAYEAAKQKAYRATMGYADCPDVLKAWLAAREAWLTAAPAAADAYFALQAAYLEAQHSVDEEPHEYPLTLFTTARKRSAEGGGYPDGWYQESL